MSYRHRKHPKRDSGNYVVVLCLFISGIALLLLSFSIRYIHSDVEIQDVSHECKASFSP